ncbi:MAG: TlpA family protein disulfide reductase [Acidobacteria bacterium]|nr:TlpA family protein disulfide reductase [Acidobacteriota bacterium]
MTRRHFNLLAGALAGAPAVSLKPLDEKIYNQLVAGAKGKVLLIDFWATWCDPCRDELPLLIKMSRKLAHQGLDFVPISCDEPEDEPRAAAFLAQSGYAGMAYVKRVKSDDAFIRWLEPQWSGALPALFLYSRQGRKVKSIVGETDLAALETAVAKLTASQA